MQSVIRLVRQLRGDERRACSCTLGDGIESFLQACGYTLWILSFFSLCKNKCISLSSVHTVCILYNVLPLWRQEIWSYGEKSEIRDHWLSLTFLLYAVWKICVRTVTCWNSPSHGKGINYLQNAMLIRYYNIFHVCWSAIWYQNHHLLRSVIIVRASWLLVLFFRFCAAVISSSSWGRLCSRSCSIA